MMIIILLDFYYLIFYIIYLFPFVLILLEIISKVFTMNYWSLNEILLVKNEKLILASLRISKERNDNEDNLKAIYLFYNIILF